jgi:hypothetical protein
VIFTFPCPELRWLPHFVAVLFPAFAEKSSSHRDEVKTALKKACRDMGYDRNTQGSGGLDIKNLLE